MVRHRRSRSTEQDSVTYAKETLLTTTLSQFHVRENYLLQHHEGLTCLFAPVVITANAGDDYVVVFDLEGMVFGADVMDGQMTLLARREREL